MSLKENNLEKELRLYKERGKERGKEKQDEEREWMVASESEEIYDMQPYENTRDLETGGEISLETELMHQKYLDNLKGEKKNLDYYRRLNIVLPENQAFADEIMPVWGLFLFYFAY
ncbi:uncharacterized protein LOC111699313 [Eurytemora carolleeae]|uniref:uncharacterized protein LOC111699313 n=1 Tax=Eurytemora carolleeae TaxID=1294199 RepID=UPI000C75C67E|nr:uncharacterized protein LOC111699313 [Eurytemora carolleeae]|eukprot:XP_023325723.1 uncharacterized protein LOC111699313 [Eurytemora affinis]